MRAQLLLAAQSPEWGRLPCCSKDIHSSAAGGAEAELCSRSWGRAPAPGLALCGAGWQELWEQGLYVWEEVTVPSGVHTGNLRMGGDLMEFNFFGGASETFGLFMSPQTGSAGVSPQAWRLGDDRGEQNVKGNTT